MFDACKYLGNSHTVGPNNNVRNQQRGINSETPAESMNTRTFGSRKHMPAAGSTQKHIIRMHTGPGTLFCRETQMPAAGFNPKSEIHTSCTDTHTHTRHGEMGLITTPQTNGVHTSFLTNALMFDGCRTRMRTFIRVWTYSCTANSLPAMYVV